MTKKRFWILNVLTENSGIKDRDKLLSFDEVVDLLNELSNENEQLKQSIKKIIELLSEEVDVFSEKSTEHDIIAYRELNKLDNKDAYYMATATKKAIRMLKELIE